MKLLIINGVNLNLLGKREKSIYGQKSLDEINAELFKYSKIMDIELSFFQSNIEGEIVNAIHNFEGNGIILNAGAYTHYSYAIRDAISSVETEVVEVHLSNVFAREEFRHTSVLSSVCKGVICGFNYKSYLLAINSFLL